MPFAPRFAIDLTAIGLPRGLVLRTRVAAAIEQIVIASPKTASELQALLAGYVASTPGSGTTIAATGLGWLTSRSLAHVDTLESRGVSVSHDALPVDPQTMAFYQPDAFTTENGQPA